MSGIVSLFGYGAASVLAGAVVYSNLPTRFTIGCVKPTVAYLAESKLRKIVSEKELLPDEKAGDIFAKGPVLVMAVRRPGCILCRREAAALSELKPKLDKSGIRLLGVVHEIKGVDDFKPYFKGDVFFDAEKHFYGPNSRWMPAWMGMLRFSTYANIYAAKKKGFSGNTDGEGRLLGGVYLINKDQMAYAHLEKQWGDAANVDEVSEAIDKMQ